MFLMSAVPAPEQQMLQKRPEGVPVSRLGAWGGGAMPLHPTWLGVLGGSVLESALTLTTQAVNLRGSCFALIWLMD